MEKQTDISVKPKSTLTPNQRYMAFKKYPGLLAEDIVYIFEPVITEGDKGVQNHILAKINRFCPNADELITNVATAIIKTAKEGRTE